MLYLEPWEIAQVSELPPRQPGGLGRALASAGAKSATNLSGMLQRSATAAVKARGPMHD